MKLLRARLPGLFYRLIKGQKMKFVCAATFFLAGTSTAFAANGDSPADSIVVTASRTEVGGISTIGSNTIDSLQPTTALELLDRLAGVRAFSKGGSGGSSYLSIRGGEPNFTLVLLDGVKVNDPTNSQGGAFDLAQIDPYILASIEVARGARSAIHGADALSGVVNLRLRQVEAGERFASVRANVDTQGAVGTAGGLGYGWQDGGLIAGVSLFDSGDLTEGSDLGRRQFVTKVVQNLPLFDLSALALHSKTDREAFPEDSGGPRGAVVRDRERRKTAATVTSLKLSAREDNPVRPSVAVNWSRQDVDVASPPIPPDVPSITGDSRFERLEIVAAVRGQPVPRLSVAGGAGYTEEDGRSRGTIDLGELAPANFNIGRHVTSIFGEATFTPLPSLALTAGARLDNPSKVAAEWMGRASAKVGPLFASVAEGYKLPSLYALAYPLIANPNLMSERSRSIEVGLGQHFRGADLRVAYFRNRYRDLIDFDSTLFTNVNRASVTTQGVEAELSGTVANAWDLAGSLTYLHVDSEAPLRSRPAWQGSISVNWRPSDRVTVGLAGRSNSDFLDSSVPTGIINVKGHSEIDLSLRYAMTHSVTLSIAARNALSADYEDAVGFPSPGRTLRISMAAQF